METTPLLKVAPSTTDALVKRIGIPLRPSTLVQLHNEIAMDDPDIRLIAGLVLNVQDTEDWVDRLFHDFSDGLA